MKKKNGVNYPYITKYLKYLRCKDHCCKEMELATRVQNPWTSCLYFT